MNTTLSNVIRVHARRALVPLQFMGADTSAPRSATLQQAYDAYVAAQTRYTNAVAKKNSAAADKRSQANATAELNAAKTALDKALSQYSNQAETERVVAENEARISQAQYDVVAAQQKALTIKTATAQLTAPVTGAAAPTTTPVATTSNTNNPGATPFTSSDPIAQAVVQPETGTPRLYYIFGGLAVLGGAWWLLSGRTRSRPRSA